MINKQTKMILGLAAVGVAGYFVFKSMKPKTQNFVRKRKASTLSSPCGAGGCTPKDCLCGECCDGGKCYYAVYDAQGNATYRALSCSGTGESQINQLSLGRTR